MRLPIGTKTAIAVTAAVNDQLSTYINDPVNDMMLVRALNDAKVVAAHELMAHNWKNDDAWERVSKFEIETSDGEWGTIIDIKDRWTEDD